MRPSKRVESTNFPPFSDSKTAPRTIWLSSAARANVYGLPRKTTWIFPSPRTNGFLTAATLDELWYRVK